MTNQQIEPTYALLWSYTQGCFHVEPLRTMLEKNRRCYVEGRATDFVVVFIGGDSECRLASSLLRRTLAEYGRKTPPVEEWEPTRVGDLCDAFMADLTQRVQANQQASSATPQ